MARYEFRRPSVCTYDNDDHRCVLVATNVPGRVAVRDGKDPDGPTMEFSDDEWRALVTSVKLGDFDV